MRLRRGSGCSMLVKLSVCIVAYNNYEDVKATVTSIEEYTSPKLTKKIYIVDNGAAVSQIEEVEKFKKYVSIKDDVEYIGCKLIPETTFKRAYNE